MTQKKIAFFMGHDITPLIMLNKIIPYLQQHNIKPEIHLPAYHSCSRTQIPEYTDISFYDGELTHDVIYPFLEQNGIDSQNVYSINQLAKKHDLNVVKVDNVNINQDYLNELLADPYVIGAISLFCVQIFKDEIIDILREKGFFWNLHPGLLPHIRGLSAPFWAMQRGETYYGPTLHHVNKGIDEGSLLRMHRLPLNHKIPYFLNRLNTAGPGAELVIQQLEKELNGQHEMGWEQDHTLSTYYTYPTGPEIRKFEASGCKMFASPTEMARLYMSLFRPDDEVAARQLQNIILKAVSDHEAEKKRQLQRVV